MIEDPQVKANLAANVARLLKDRGWTQADLAARTGDPETTISRVVRGLNVVGLGVAVRIAEAFDVSLDRLTGPPPKPIFRKTG